MHGTVSQNLRQLAFMRDEILNEGQPFLSSRAAELGFSRTDFRDLSATHRVRQVFRGVYVDNSVPDTRTLRAAALHLVKPDDAVYYGTTVAFLLGVDAFPPKDRYSLVPQCVVPHHGARCKRTNVRCREGFLPRADLMEIDGLVVTTPVRSTVDMLRSMWRPNALAAADAMAHSALITREEVRAYVAKMKRYPGIIQARALAALIEPLTESPGESWQRLRLVDAGFPVPKPQVTVRDRIGRTVAILDHGYEAVRVGIDYDGREFHADDVAERHDETKRAYLVDVLGWRLSIGKRERIFGTDPGFEEEIGGWLGITPLPRRW